MSPRRITDSTRRKWEQFVGEYVVDFNASRAYLECGCFNVKDKTVASSSASKLLNDSIVREMIAAEVEKKKSRLELKQDLILLEQLRIAMSDPRNYLEWGNDGVRVIDSKDITEDAARAIESVEINETDDGTGTVKRRVKIKMWSKSAALDALGKHFGLYREEINVNHKYGSIALPVLASADEWERVVSAHANGKSKLEDDAG